MLIPPCKVEPPSPSLQVAYVEQLGCIQKFTDTLEEIKEEVKDKKEIYGEANE